MANSPDGEMIRQTVIEWNMFRESQPNPDLSGLDLTERNLCGADLSGCNLSLANLSGASLRGANLQRAWLGGTVFRSADVSRGDFRNIQQSAVQTSFHSVHSGLPIEQLTLTRGVPDFREAILCGANFQGSNLRGTSFVDADLRDANFRRSELEGCDLHWANLTGCDFRQAELRDANLSYCNMAGANLQRANLEGSDLRLVNIRSADLLGANLRRVRFGWLTDATEMRGARNLLLAFVSEDLCTELGFPANHNENVEKLDFRSYLLEDANLESADFRSAIFDSTKCSRANFRSALLVGASMRGADLRGSDLTNCNFTSADLYKADLRGADASGAIFTDANLQGANLESCKGLKLEQIQRSTNYLLAQLDGYSLSRLDLPLDHNERVRAGDYTEYKLRGAYLRKADLGNALLCRGDLTRANLDGATLCQADLRDAILEDASLVKADLKGAILSGARLRNADLRDAELQASQILSTRQLAGTNVSGAKLPDNVKSFDALQSIRESSENSRKLFVSLSLLAAYSCLTIGATKDAALLTNTGTLQLPIIQTQIPISWFYWVTPLMLLGTFLYFQFYLQNLWEELSQLPAYFPDGRPLHQRVYPWLVNSIARIHFSRLRSERGTLDKIQYAVTILLTWWVVPLTQLVFWLRYLPRHEWVGTIIHVVLAVASFTVALFFLRLAGATLQGRAGDSSLRNLFGGSAATWRTLTLVAVFALILSALSYGAIKAEPDHAIVDPRTWVPQLFRRLHLKYAAQLSEEDISIKPNNWSERDPPFDSVKGAHLAARDLRNVEARHAFLVGADLTGSSLEYGDLRDADLRHSNLTAADLKGADLTGARLDGARLDGCNLFGAIGYSPNSLTNHSISPK